MIKQQCLPNTKKNRRNDQFVDKFIGKHRKIGKNGIIQALSNKLYTQQITFSPHRQSNSKRAKKWNIQSAKTQSNKPEIANQDFNNKRKIHLQKFRNTKSKKYQHIQLGNQIKYKQPKTTLKQDLHILSKKRPSITEQNKRPNRCNSDIFNSQVQLKRQKIKRQETGNYKFQYDKKLSPLAMRSQSEKKIIQYARNKILPPVFSSKKISLSRGISSQPSSPTSNRRQAKINSQRILKNSLDKYAVLHLRSLQKFQQKILKVQKKAQKQIFQVQCKTTDNQFLIQ